MSVRLENKVSVSYAYLPPMKTILLLFAQKWQLWTVYRLGSKTKAVVGQFKVVTFNQERLLYFT